MSLINVHESKAWWQCRMCKRQFEYGETSMLYTIGEEGFFCEECYKGGIIWAIEMAYKETQDER